MPNFSLEIGQRCRHREVLVDSKFERACDPEAFFQFIEFVRTRCPSFILTNDRMSFRVNLVKKQTNSSRRTGSTFLMSPKIEKQNHTAHRHIDTISGRSCRPRSKSTFFFFLMSRCTSSKEEMRSYLFIGPCEMPSTLNQVRSHGKQNVKSV